MGPFRAACLAGACVTAFAGCAVPVSATRDDLGLHPRRHALPPRVGDFIWADPLDVRLDRQSGATACGAHAVGALLDYWNRAIPDPDRLAPPDGAAIVRMRPPAAKDGYSVAELVQILRDEGMAALAVTTTWEGLADELAGGRPAIVRVRLPSSAVSTRTIVPDATPILGPLQRVASARAEAVTGMLFDRRVDHFWLVAGQSETHVTVLDPAMGFRVVQRDFFEDVFSDGGRLAVVVGGWHR